jgi:hypothetical protein
VLAETEVALFTEQYGFRLLHEDGVATNPDLHLSVEAFAPSKGFQPSKPYRSRLAWRDFDGNTQSRLLLSSPKNVVALAVRGEREPDSPEENSRSILKQSPSARRKARKRATSKAPSPI